MHDSGFPYLAGSTAQILILGSMPGRKSLAENQYYAHAQNAFWPIMAELFDLDSRLEYEQRLTQLCQRHVALWDVAHQCIRPGSMDHAIEIESVLANDFTTFFNMHPHIRVIFFNGRKAEALFRKLVQPELPKPYQQIKQYLLPSTSPANARLSRAKKFEAWKIVAQTLENA